MNRLLKSNRQYLIIFVPVVALYFIVFGTPFYFTFHVKLNSNEILKKTLKAVCDQNEVQENLIKKADLDYLSTEELRHLFYEFITKSSEGLCPNWVRLGGGFARNTCHDGHKYICFNQNLLSAIEKDKCLVYSFGIRDDWSFEKEIRDIGCKVLRFDPSVDYPSELDKGISFEKLGVGIWKRDGNPEFKNRMKTLKTILADHQHLSSNISYLKIDIEGAELEGLLEWQNSGALAHVQQIGIEYHMEAEWMSQSKHDQYKTILKALQKLYVETNFRLVHYDFNLCWARHVDWVTKANGYPAFSEIVLMRTNKNGLCA